MRDYKSTDKLFCTAIIMQRSVTSCYEYHRIAEKEKRLDGGFSFSKEGLSLNLSWLEVKTKKIPFSDEDVEYFDRQPIDGATMHYSFADKAVTVGDKFFETIESSKNEQNLLTDSAVAQFIAELLCDSNPYVYKLFTTQYGINKNLSDFTNQYLCFNFLKFASQLDKLEAIAKTMGPKFLYLNLCKNGFEIDDEKKKINQVLAVPKKSLDGLKKVGSMDCYNYLKNIAAVDPNYALDMTNYLVSINKLFGRRELGGLNNTLDFMKSCEFVITNFKVTMKSLLNFLVREKTIFGLETFRAEVSDVLFHKTLKPNCNTVLSIPFYEAKELVDYLRLAMTIIPMDEIEVLPRDILKTFRLLLKNTTMISRPREAEFKAAVEKYRYVNWQSDIHIFRAPTDEQDLFREGNKLQHCVSTYRDIIIDSNVEVVFMRNISAPNEPFITIELTNGVATQVKTKYDNEVQDPNIYRAISTWLSIINRQDWRKK